MFFSHLDLCFETRLNVLNVLERVMVFGEYEFLEAVDILLVSGLVKHATVIAVAA